MKLAIAAFLTLAFPGQSSPPAPESWWVALVVDFGRAAYTSCRTTAMFGQPGQARVDMRCTPNTFPTRGDVEASRSLTTAESATLTEIVRSANLYSGGYAGSWGQQANDGTSQRLEVDSCCNPGRRAVLVIDDNPTFASGSRRELLQLLTGWDTELRTKLK